MDKKSKILVMVFIALVLMAVAFTFYKTVILQDFEVIDSSEGEEFDTEIADNQSDEEDLGDFAPEPEVGYE